MLSKRELPNIEIPEWKNCIIKPRNPSCQIIDSTRLLVEILWCCKNASLECKDSELISNINIDGAFSLIVRYKREKNGKYYPTCMLSFEQDDQWNIFINQLQWIKNKVSFRCFSSFDFVEYYLKIIEDSFSKRWIFVWVKSFPNGLENATTRENNALWNYEKLRQWVMNLNMKYCLNKKDK